MLEKSESANKIWRTITTLFGMKMSFKQFQEKMTMLMVKWKSHLFDKIETVSIQGGSFRRQM